MHKKLGHRHYLALTTFATLVLVMSYDKIHLETKLFISKFDAFWNSTPEPRRKGLLIIGHGRSGTSFVSKMFANGLRVSLPVRHRSQQLLLSTFRDPPPFMLYIAQKTDEVN